MPTLRLLAPILVLLLAACGKERSPAGPPEGLDGPPRWRLTTEGGSGEGQALTLNVRTPVRVRLRQEGSTLMPQSTRWRTLAAGQTVRVNWAHEREERGTERDRPGRANAEAGRTEVHAVRTHHHFADDAVTNYRMVGWARPGIGRVLVDEALPPGRYEDLPMRTSLELQTIAVADVAGGGVGLRRRDRQVRLLTPETMGPEDRVEIWRLFLDIEPVVD